jgi:hypothetical protein
VVASGRGRVSISKLFKEDEDQEIERFLGQLWSVPCSRSRRGGSPLRNLFWVRKEVWDAREFQPKDFFPVQPGDILRSDLKHTKFAKDIWGKGSRHLFLQVLKSDMAGRARGKGGERKRESF